jgi:hypothetical protein
MFEKIDPMHVRSSWGFEVKWWRSATQIYVEYREGDHVLRYDNTQNATELGYPLFSIMPKYVQHWLPPFKDESIGHRERKRIIENMAAALDFMGVSTNVLHSRGAVIAEFDKQGWVWKAAEWQNV